MLDNLLRPYMPHIEAARDRCNDWGRQVLRLLEDLRFAIQEGDEPDVSYAWRITLPPMPATQITTIAVPLDELWEVDFLFLNGAAGTVQFFDNGQAVSGFTLPSRSDAFGLVVRPGSTIGFLPTADATGIMQVKRYKVTDDGQPIRRARSAGGKEGRFGSGIPQHETERDVMDIGIPQLIPPPPYGGSDV